MRKGGLYILVLGFIFVLTGCTTDSIFVTESTFEGSTFEFEPSIVITQQDREISETFEAYTLTSEERDNIVSNIEELVEIISFSPETSDKLAENFTKLLAFSASSDDEAFINSIAEALTPTVEIDAKLMTEAGIKYQLKYKADFSKVRKVPDSETYYIPIVFYIHTISASEIDVQEYIDQYAALSEEEVTQEDKDSIKTSLEAGLKHYVNLVGKYKVTSNGYVAALKEGDNFRLALEDTLDKELPNDSQLNLDTASEWANSSIQDLYMLNVIDGNQFSNYKTAITRGAFCKLIVKTDEYRTSSNTTIGEDPFIDTDDRYVLKAYAMEIINGVSANTFNPNGNLTREQCATIIANYLNLTETGSMGSYNDDQSISVWAKEAVYKLKHAGIMSGANNTFSPQGELTVEQAISLISRLIDQY